MVTMALRRLSLVEFRTEPRIFLTIEEREALRKLWPGIRIEPTPNSNEHFDLTPDQRIGLVCAPDLVIEIRPKIPMSSVLFLISHACDAAKWFDEQPEFGEEPTLTDALAIMLARMAERATRRGLLNGYQTEEEALQAPRGRI